MKNKYVVFQSKRAFAIKTGGIYLLKYYE